MVEASAPNIECLGVHCFVYFLPFPSSTLVARQPLWAKYEIGLQQPDISLKQGTMPEKKILPLLRTRRRILMRPATQQGRRGRANCINDVPGTPILGLARRSYLSE